MPNFVPVIDPVVLDPPDCAVCEAKKMDLINGLHGGGSYPMLRLTQGTLWTTGLYNFHEEKTIVLQGKTRLPMVTVPQLHLHKKFHLSFDDDCFPLSMDFRLEM